MPPENIQSDEIITIPVCSAARMFPTHDTRHSHRPDSSTHWVPTVPQRDRDEFTVHMYIPVVI